MDSDSIQDRPVSVENVSSAEMEAESINIDSLEVVSSGGTHELESAVKILTRAELDLACSSEKLVNLDLLLMHVASRENDFEAFASEEKHTLEGPVQKALEFDILYWFLDSEVRVLESFLTALQTEIGSSRGFISSFKQLGDAFGVMEEKVQDCENSLKQSFERLEDIKVQSSKFRRILLASSGDENWKDDRALAGLENGSISDSNAKIKMQTAEQQRNILRMLEKSLAREMDLEKKLTESRQTEEDLKHWLQQEVFCMEAEFEDMWERLFESENSAEILLGVSKELFGQAQMAQLCKNESIQREEELRSQLQDLNEQLKEKDSVLQGAESSRNELVEKVNSLEQKLGEFESQLQLVKDSSEQLKGKAAEAEKKAETAEAECELLRESNVELNEDVSRLKSNLADATEKAEQLERRLKDSEIKRLHAEASAEASQEKQNMLDCTIKDMENLIKDLKAMVLKAESQTESAEEKCIILSESNAELFEEVNLLRRKMEHMEVSLHQANEAKKETAKDIRVRTKLITDLVMQLALERERLHKQISSLTKEKKVALKYLQQIKNPSVTVIGSDDAKVKESVLSENDRKNGTSSKEINEETTGSSAADDEIREDLSTTDIKTDDADSSSNLNTVRNIDARQLKFKYIFMVVLVLVIPLFAAFLFLQ
ncbi:hypothetical protein CDL12_28119 [Handroanthus impetiginosus]|uniref:WIT1/2 N-terminal helical bundle domain-containing protein n=1 Tax=Handroanthus impetiginosus TaxID=429701 RepID=A0A2G9G237_9LAMI|nr:hypothetical protein CDL12_28119 [Handroanthus impetiginosus]